METYQDTPLHIAVCNLASNEELKAITKKFSVNVLGAEKNTPLLSIIMASANNYVKLMDLDSSEAVKTVKDNFFAEKNRIIEWLLDNNADVNLENIYKKQPLFYAIKHKSINESIVLKILAKTNKLDIGLFCNIYLSLSIIAKKEEVALKLIERGVNVETLMTTQGHVHSNLIYSIMNNLNKLSAKLLSMNVNLFVASYHGDHLYLLIKNGFVNLAEQMIKHNFGINYVKKNKTQINKLRLRSRKKLLYKTYDGNIIDNIDVHNLINVCIKYEQEDLALMMLDRIQPNNSNFTITIRVAIRHNMNIFIAKFLNKYIDSLNNVNFYGNTILHEAFYNNNTYAAAILLAKKFRTDIKNNVGYCVNDFINSKQVSVANLIKLGNDFMKDLEKNSNYHYHDYSVNENENKIDNHDNNKSLKVELKENVNGLTRNTELRNIEKILTDYDYTEKSLNTLINYNYLDGNNAFGYLINNYDYFTTHSSNIKKRSVIDIIDHIFSNKDPKIFDQPNIFNNTPLHYAIKFKVNEIAILLINCGYNINAINKKLDTPLTLAIKTRNLVIIAKLLDNPEININTQNKYGYTSLNIAINMKLDSVVERLMNMNCNFTFCRDNGKHFIRIISSRYENVAIKYYKTNGDCGVDALCKVVQYEMYKLAKLMIKDKVLCEKTKLSLSVIYLLNNSQIKLAQLLLDTYPNIPINYADKKGNTMLHVAVSADAMDIAKQLIFKGCRTTKKNCRQKTILDISRDVGNTSIIEKYIDEYNYQLLKNLLDNYKDNLNEEENDNNDKNVAITVTGKKRNYDAFVEGDNFVSI